MAFEFTNTMEAIASKNNCPQASLRMVVHKIDSTHGNLARSRSDVHK